jgi:hypothetical protein
MKDSTFGIYFDLFCAAATLCQHSVASNFMIKNPDFLGVYTNKNGKFIL